MNRNPLQKLIRLFLILSVFLLLLTGAAAGALTVYQKTQSDPPITAEEQNAALNAFLSELFFSGEE